MDTETWDDREAPAGHAPVRDRTVEAAVRNVLEPIFERDFAEHSYGFRPGRGCREAVARVEGLLSEGFDFLGWHFRGGKKSIAPAFGISSKKGVPTCRVNRVDC